MLPPSSSSAAAPPTATTPQANDTATTAATTPQELIEIDGSDSDDNIVDREQAPPDSADASEAATQQVDASGADSATDDDDLTIDDIVLDTSRLSKIDLDAVFALPPHLQKDMINRILSDRRQEVRNKFIPLAGKPEAYSHTQLSAFLATTALHRRIDAAKKKHRDLVETPVAADAGADAAKLGPGKRIASRSDRFFVYTRAEDRIGEEEDAGSDSDTAGDSVVHEMDAIAASASVTTNTDDAVSGSDFPLLTRLRHKKRAFRDEEEIGKQPLSDLSVASMKEFAMQAQRQQARQWGVQDATTAWYASHAAAPTKSEPTLAIEQARRKRLKLEEKQASPATASHSSSNKSEKTADATNVCISFKTEDVSSADLARFHASLFAPKAEAASAKALDDVSRDEETKNDDEVQDDDDDVGTCLD